MYDWSSANESDKSHTFAVLLPNVAFRSQYLVNQLATYQTPQIGSICIRYKYRMIRLYVSLLAVSSQIGPIFSVSSCTSAKGSPSTSSIRPPARLATEIKHAYYLIACPGSLAHLVVLRSIHVLRMSHQASTLEFQATEGV